MHENKNQSYLVYEYVVQLSRERDGEMGKRQGFGVSIARVDRRVIDIERYTPCFGQEGTANVVNGERLSCRIRRLHSSLFCST